MVESSLTNILSLPRTWSQYFHTHTIQRSTMAVSGALSNFGKPFLCLPALPAFTPASSKRRSSSSLPARLFSRNPAPSLSKVASFWEPPQEGFCNDRTFLSPSHTRILQIARCELQLQKFQTTLANTHQRSWYLHKTTSSKRKRKSFLDFHHGFQMGPATQKLQSQSKLQMHRTLSIMRGQIPWAPRGCQKCFTKSLQRFDVEKAFKSYCPAFFGPQIIQSFLLAPSFLPRATFLTSRLVVGQLAAARASGMGLQPFLPASIQQVPC